MLFLFGFFFFISYLAHLYSLRIAPINDNRQRQGILGGDLSTFSAPVCETSQGNLWGFQLVSCFIKRFCFHHIAPPHKSACGQD